MLSRRGLLRGGLALGCSAAAFPLATRVTFASVPGDNRLVVIILRGAMDGLAAVAPYEDRDYLRLRPTIATTPDRGAFDLDGRFALHPSLAPLAPLWKSGELAFAHAVSTPYRDKRSHFDGQDFLEHGGGGSGGEVGPKRDGWLNRALAQMPGASSTTAVAVGRENMILLDGAFPTRSWSPNADLQMTEHGLNLLRMISSDDPLFSAAYAEAREIDARVDAMEGVRSRREDAISLATLTAEMLNGESRIAAFSIGGFDTHRGQEGTIRKPFTWLSDAVTTLKTGLGRNWERTAVVAVTEFGRTARENGSRGTDHGTGGLMLFAGGALAAAKVHGKWPGLDEADLYRGRDLTPTEDLRRYAAWSLRELFGLDERALEREVFPGLSMGADPRVFA